ncbi:flagellar biosynthesis protein FlhB [Tropicibacter sp. R16_0]|uniref:flagellar type III secretion system protein FlhB n=1 Tax=Tropicibacter sp. R16_0 TaxID=2821102 RepID=UPI001AD99C64|nr:flagellar type III secretion system protein FlhB [Tropicibacter sp. R16_0]MBO9450368.1 flagellar biosynthesis protein FlhB [Tropicibacter sp. R16_0]
MSAADDDTEKSFDPTPQKLQKAREKGEVAKSADLSVVAAYAGLVLVFLAIGHASITSLGTTLMIFLDQPEGLSNLLVNGPSAGPAGGMIGSVALAIGPWFLVPMAAIILSVIAQRAFLVTPSKLQPKLSRISLISNAKNKFGRGGLFEFAKSFTKLILYSICLGVFLHANMSDIISSTGVAPRIVVPMMMDLVFQFMFIVLAVALMIGSVDYIWQYFEHIRKNRMSRKEITDETKDAEGDPHMKQQRRQKGQQIAMNQMMADVPDADVVIVNPTHYAVVLKWSRLPGAAPVCVAKGVDEVAGTIRQIANENGVPIQSDPPTARAIHASVEIGEEILEEHYKPVAAAIRFAETMRKKAKEGV